MPKIAVQAAVPGGGPDTLAAATPPNYLFLAASDNIRIKTQATGGSITLRPYYWQADASAWIGAGNDDAVGVKQAGVTANSAGVVSAEGYFTSDRVGRFWIVVKESGAGSAAFCYIDEVPFPITH